MGKPVLPFANNKGADQPAQPRSLISAFVIRCLDSIIAVVSICKISSLLLVSIAEQASLSLPWSQTPETGFLMTRLNCIHCILGRVKRIWYLSSMRAAKVQASLRIRAVSPEPSLLAHSRSESRGTFRQKARSLASQNGWACAVN